MTNPTSNFGWQMPTSTDLVTDLPADFAVFGQAVDTSMADLKGGTTGQILSKTTNTDMDFTWITNDQGDITAVNTTAPLQGGGTSGALTLSIDAGSTTVVGAVQLEDSTASTSTTKAATPNSVKSAYDLANGAIAKTTVTTAGDIIYRNATVPTRLGIGTAGQVLQVNSGATAPEWATASSGWTNLVASTAFGAVASVTLSSISQSYKDLRIIVTGWSSVTGGGMQIAFNNTNTGYGGLYVDYTGTFVVARTNNGRAYFRMGDGLYSTVTGDYVIDLPFYSRTNNMKFGQGLYSGQDGGSGADCAGQFNFYKSNTSAISSIVLTTSGGNFDAGSYELWGKN